MNGEVVLVFGDQLFPQHRLGALAALPMLMVESRELCQHVRYHRHKLTFHLAAMRHYADERRGQGCQVVYRPLEEDDGSSNHWQTVIALVRAHGWRCIRCFPPSDRFARQALEQHCQDAGIALRLETDNPLFITPLGKLDAWIRTCKRLQLGDFWKWQRQRSGLLLDTDGQPVGGRWSFDTENRNPLPRHLQPPPWNPPQGGPLEQEVLRMVNRCFPDHPGQESGMAWATTRKQAQAVWQEFLGCRLHAFGTYQDAMSADHDILYHSVISPYLNVGLLDPQDLLADVVKAHESGQAPLAAVEGWCRQVAGWREFVHGVDRIHGAHQDQANHFQARRRLAPCWYQGDSGIPALDHLVNKLQRCAYGHHIERLMVAGNLMLLCAIAPREGWRWFMECFIDSADWVMGPNVLGMSLYADGGMMTTKPYACGAPYIKKMGRWPGGPWEEGVSALYWAFIARNQEEFLGNRRMARAVWSWQRMTPSAQGKRLDCAAEWMDRLSSAS